MNENSILQICNSSLFLNNVSVLQVFGYLAIHAQLFVLKTFLDSANLLAQSQTMQILNKYAIY